MSAAPSASPAEIRRAFLERQAFGLDHFQTSALDALDRGHSVLVAAPTGSGKTIVAEYAVAIALATGAKVFYTTPLKALSNQKYHDLVAICGDEAVGLLTGDNSINGDAPVVVMTTEVLRNMIYARSPALDGLRYVVLDEVHYLQNRFRGAVWEEVIIHLPEQVDLVCLSATVSNAEEVADWLRTVRGAAEAVIEERRPVELEHLYAVGDRGSERLHLLPTFVDVSGELQPNPEAQRFDARGGRQGPPQARRRGRLYAPWRSELVERLAEEGMLPAIYFVFSRKGCDEAVRHCTADSPRLTDPAERRALREIAERHTELLTDEDLDALGYDEWLVGLEAGYAAHHAGLVPPMKEAVEEGFAAGLVKVVFATETLSLGINMPARTVVIDKLTKFTGEHHEFLTPGEYTQLAGRAGRRGIDDLGFVVVPWNPFVTFEQVSALASRRTYALTSSFRPTYNMTANLVRRYSADDAHHLLNLSFAQYHADRDVVGIERLAERTRAQLAERRAFVGDDADDLRSYRALLGEREQPHAASAGRFEALRPGDVITGPRIERAVVVRHERSGGRPRVLVVTPARRVFKVGVEQLHAPEAVAHMTLPKPYAPRNPRFIRDAAAVLAALEIDAEALARREPGPAEARRRRVRDHPLADDPRLPSLLRAAQAIDRLERELARQERRIEQRGDSLARQFDRVRSLLEAWNYVDGWTLTPAGETLARLYSEDDLMVAEAVRDGLFDGLDPPALAALASCFTYERRGPDTQSILAPRRWPDREVAKRYRAVERIWRELDAAERDARLPTTRPPDPGFTPMIHAWVRGEPLSDVLDEDLTGEDITGGDFVRHVKQVVDLVRQLGDLLPEPASAAAARAAAEACVRGVVAASTMVAP